MKKLMLVFPLVMAGVLSGCYSVTRNSVIELSGKVVAADGTSQMVDLNTGSEICISANYERSFDGAAKVKLCQAFTTATNGQFQVRFMADDEVLNMIWRSSSAVRLKDFRAYLKLAHDGREIIGNISSVKETAPHQFQGEVTFITSISNYKPDVKIEVNSTSRKY